METSLSFNMGMFGIIAELLVETVITSFSQEIDGRAGGYFSIYDEINHTMLTVAFGYLPEEKRHRYLRNSQEKIQRLLQLPDDHRSFQSRNEEEQKYGGGIRQENFICAFSGFPEKFDEAISLIYGTQLIIDRFLKPDVYMLREWVSKHQQDKYSDNEWIMPVVDAFIEKYLAKRWRI